MITNLSRNWILKPLKYVDNFVSDSLSETISPGYRFRYVDISSVSCEAGIENYSEMTFAESPSRARKRVVAGDTIVSTVRTYLKAIARIDDADDVIVSTGFSVIRARDHISDYLYYLCTSDLFCQQVNKYSWGIAYPAISEKLMGRILVPVPPIEEQVLIAGFLDKKCASINATVSILENQIATLERYRASVIHEAVTKGLNSDIPLKPSGVDWIGDIPKSWECKKLKYCYKFITGFTPDTSNTAYYDSDGFTWVSIADLTSADTIINTSETGISEIFVKEKHPQLTPDGSLLYSFKLSVGKCAFAGCSLYTNEAIASFLPSGENSLRYLYYASSLLINNANENIYSAKLLNRYLIANAPIPLPPVAEQISIADYLDARIAAIDTILETKRKQIDVLKRRRQSLIYEYVTGKRRVRKEM